MAKSLIATARPFKEQHAENEELRRIRENEELKRIRDREAIKRLEERLYTKQSPHLQPLRGK